MRGWTRVHAQALVAAARESPDKYSNETSRTRMGAGSILPPQHCLCFEVDHVACTVQKSRVPVGSSLAFSGGGYVLFDRRLPLARGWQTRM